MKKDLVKNWMTPNPVTIDAQATLEEARHIMRDFRIRRLPVIKDNMLVGIFTLGDLHIAELTDALVKSGTDLSEMVTQFKTVEDVMTRNPLTVFVDSTLGEAITIMLAYKIGGMPVVEGDKLVGILTETDIYRSLKEISPPADATLTNRQVNL